MQMMMHAGPKTSIGNALGLTFADSGEGRRNTFLGGSMTMCRSKFASIDE